LQDLQTNIEMYEVFQALGESFKTKE